MKFNTLLIKFGLMLVTLAALVLSGCSKDEGIDNRDHGYGHLQIKLYKKGVSRAANELEYLRDASKIQVNFLYNGRNFNQTLLLSYSDEESAEFGLRSETIKLASGDYQILSYTVYNNLEQTLVTEKLGDPIALKLTDGTLTMQDLEVSTVLRGKFYFRITKILPDTRASRDEYTFNEITKADITVEDSKKNTQVFNNLKCTFQRDLVNGSSFVLCDTLWIPAGTYKFKEIRLRDASSNDLEYIQNPTGAGYTNIVIKDVTENYLTPVDVPIEIKKTAKYIQDYLALRDIWTALEGQNWSYVGQNYPAGANWDFSGDVDLWGDQPGVGLHNNGRVASLDIGPFDPHGKIPAAIGKLTELTILSIGTHNDAFADDAVPEFDEQGRPTGQKSLSRRYTGKYKNNSGSEYDDWTLIMRGIMPQSKFLERAKRAMTARNYYKKSSYKHYSSELFRQRNTNGQVKPLGTEIAKYVDVSYGYITNHITGIDDAISNCTKLESLSIANSHVSALPDGLGGMENLTSLELYNNPLMTEFPMVMADMPAIYQTILACNVQWSAAEISKGVNAIFDGRAGGPTKKIQVIYLNSNNLEEIPVNMKNGTMLGMLDLGDNKIANSTDKKLNPLTRAVAPTQLYLDDNLLTGQPFPQDFCMTDDMETFSCTNNRITQFPNIFTSDTPYVISSVDFSGNRITEIEGDDAQWDEHGNITRHATFKGINVSTLSLNDNRFKGGVPAAFSTSNPRSIIMNFGMKGNNLDSIGWKGLKGMVSIAALDLESNRISVTTKNPNFFRGEENPYMTGVNLNYNSFTDFPEDLFNGYSMNQFYFEGQNADGDRCFRKWPDGIEEYIQLKVLKMAGNDIRTVAKFPSGLNFLSIEDNPNLSMNIPDDVCARILSNMFYFSYDKSQQFITGCPGLGIGETND